MLASVIKTNLTGKDFNSFHATGLFPYPQKTENLRLTRNPEIAETFL